ncbi:MAG: asparagine--tRNA ligase [Acidobacteria bacterium]|nr:asparagine--tRNA ligase [Acidobacteriota bacterium]MCB9397852.1 asparagine--tRNA ligase [Acidobacteriota bacterium]
MIVSISALKDHLDQEVTIRGWTTHHRKSGKIQFLNMRDGSGYTQCVIAIQDVGEAIFEKAKTITQESAVAVTGTVSQNPRNQQFELVVKDLELIHIAEPFPVTNKEHGTEFLMDHRHLWFRSKRQWAILRVRHRIVRAIRDFFDSHAYTLIDTPILTPTAAEGTSNLFKVDYFEDTAYLAQTGQLYLEPALAAFGKVYCFGPTFRAEKSKTRRHLTEFWMVEPEIAFAHLEDIMQLSQSFIHYILECVLADCQMEFEVLERDTEPLKKCLQPFIRMSYTEAVEKLRALGSDITWGTDFGGDDETILTQEYEQPILVHRFPKTFKAFYFEPDPDNHEVVLGMDLLAPEGYGEVIGGGERASSVDFLIEQIAKHELNQEHYEWYLDVRRYGSMPHAGFGMGLERAVAWICKLPHVRETIPYPRMLYRLKP